MEVIRYAMQVLLNVAKVLSSSIVKRPVVQSCPPAS